MGEQFPAAFVAFTPLWKPMARVCTVQGSSPLVCKHSNILRTGGSPSYVTRGDILISWSNRTQEHLSSYLSSHICAAPDFACSENQRLLGFDFKYRGLYLYFRSKCGHWMPFILFNFFVKSESKWNHSISVGTPVFFFWFLCICGEEFSSFSLCYTWNYQCTKMHYIDT